MSELQQSGQRDDGQPHDAWGAHPDADQLSAFLEQGLPAHEREDVLAHLAVCRSCRETVAMALPPLEEQVVEFEQFAVTAPLAVRAAVAEAAAARAEAPRRRAWFARWTVWAPAGAALAALALFLAYIHHAPQRTPQEQALNVRPQEVVQSPEQPKTPAAGTPPAHAAAAGPEAKAGMKSVPPAVMGLSDVAGRERAPLAARPATPMAPAAPARTMNEQSEANPPMRFAPGVMGGPGGAGLAPGRENRQVAGQPEPKQAAGGPITAPLPFQAAAAPAPPPSAATQSVTVTAAAPIETTSAQMANASIAPLEVHGTLMGGAILQRPLPSRQSVLSIATYGSRMLAIDARHTLFLSTDSGVHWKRISGKWQGQAVRVNLVLSGTASGMAGANATGASLGSFAGRDELVANGPQGVLTGTVTDQSGAVIPGTTITVTNPATGNTRTVKTDANGHYVVEGLPPGSYNLQAVALGFESMRLGGIAVEASPANVANLTLKVGAASETVTVEAESTELESGELAKKKAATPPADVLQAPAEFVITTDTGERWTSSDGKSWKQE